GDVDVGGHALSGGQAGGVALFLLPLWEKVDRRVASRRMRGAGRSAAVPSWNTPHPTSLRSATARGESRASPALRAPQGEKEKGSVPEMPDAGEHHGDAVGVGGGDDFVVAHRAAGLDDGG